MQSIIHQHKSEFEQTALGQRLDETMIKCLKATATVNDKTGNKLVELLGIDLPKEVVMVLTRPWYRANMLASWCEQLNLPEEKEWLKDVIKMLKRVKKELTRHNPENILLLMLFKTSSEVNIDMFLKNLDDLISFFESFMEIDFKNGSEFSPKYFRRHAINSLFWMGKKMGLLETGSPTQLNKYVHIVTERVYEDINKDYGKFKKNNFLNTAIQKMNVALFFIYNPHCEETKNILSKICSRFVTA